MAILEKIRVRMGIFITVIIGLALVSFIVDANTLSSITSMFSSRTDVGKINGKIISYQDFVKRQDYYVQMSALITGSTTLSEQMQDKVREQVWEDFFKEEVLYPQYEKTGIEVSAKELLDLTQGRNVSPILQNDPVFWGETGSFSRTNVLNFIKSIDSDPSGVRAAYWKYCEDLMRDAQLLEKYMALIAKSQFTNSLELKRKVADRNTTVDITYIAQPLGLTTDSTVHVTEAAMRSYYKTHTRDFEQETSRDILYVAFPVEPSENDIRLAEESSNAIYAEFAGLPTAELDRFVTRNSDVPFKGTYYKRGDLIAKLDSFAFRATTKDVLPVFRDDNTFYMARIIKSRMLPDSVDVRHILIQDRDITRAGHLADSLIDLLGRGANFGYIARQYSADPMVNRNDGSLGWIEQGDLEQYFGSTVAKVIEDTSFVIARNRPVKIETNFGLHIIEVADRSREEQKVQLAIVEKTARPGNMTYQNVFTEANNLVSASNGQRALFETAAREKRYALIPAYAILENQKLVSTLPNSRELARWTYEAKVDQVSNVLTIDNYFVVAALTAVREKGVAPFEQVRSDIEYLLQREQQIELLAQKMQEATAGATSIEAAAEKTKLSLQPASDISFVGRSVTGIGFEPKLQGAVAGTADENVLVGPVKGTSGVYMFTISRRHVGAAYTEADEKMAEQLSTQQSLYDFYDIMRKSAKVQDWRGRFF
jgi:peptidyl-prolyl cis-trans isomerase D